MSIVIMDRQGRILIPAYIRRRIKSDIFLIEEVNGEIRLKPIKPIRLTMLFDKIVIDDVEDFTDTHKLREALNR
ncbi:hypothetical protein DRN84_01660 [Candidatus Geothermarchaeota archaeon]|nr:MAG: hypothetical protein DRN87_02280 [Candidatus Geothermarchaeota archaeon]RLG62537.1 MAG: hypothetical protein DRN84_01660 [Candidatus Geothermarchaeota archaeon]HEW93083.1 hypothetical protein [Thermoprotei archaeon]